MNKILQELMDEMGTDEVEKARDFLINRYPASSEISDASMMRALKALMRQKKGTEINALEREFLS